MKSKWPYVLLLVCFFWPIAIHLALPQAKPIPPNTQAVDVTLIANIKMNEMCLAAADFGYDAAERNLSREEMHKELKEILK